MANPAPEAQCEGTNDPLEREVGQFLWDDDEKYPYAELLQREKLIQPARNWSALFQGRLHWALACTQS
jgi:hypothetical protein